jgi:molybdate transport system ATP-binding protein
MSQLQFQCRHQYRAGSFLLHAEFTVNGGITALVGPSGSGKTTILSLIAGLLRPETGRIQLGEHTLIDTASGKFMLPENRGVGVVFQDYRLFPHLSVAENLNYGLKRSPRGQIDFAHLVEVLNLGDLLARAPQTLSGGQKQRVALGRAILRGPEILLLDEPLSAQDVQLKDDVLTYLERIIGEYRLPTLLVSHDVASVERLATRTIFVREGRIAESAAPAGRTS